MALRLSLCSVFTSAVAFQVREQRRILDIEDGNTTDDSEGQLFTDVTALAFPKTWYEWNHVGHSRNFMGTPLFQDFNDDGYLDFFYHNHFGLDPSTDWDLGVSHGRNAAHTEGHPWYKSVADTTFVSTEEPGSEYRRQEMDTHGTAILDIDRDGFLDLYITIGGGKGTEADQGKDKNSFLAWGMPPSSEQLSHEDSLGQRFKGGRDVAEKAGLANANSRGRFTYFADFNKDGLLDVFFSNDVRADDLNAFGYAMMNQGDRSFHHDFFMSEYAFTMMLTDANGDGHADEFVVQRRNCLPPASSKEHVTTKQKEFCEERPSGSTAVYKYDMDAGHMKLISNRLERSTTKDSDDFVWSMQTGDFDSDEVSDLVTLKDNSITFYLSSHRDQGQLPVGKGAFNITWPIGECTGRALRTGDFDLDGDQELLVMCAEYGQHRLYMQSDDKSKWHLWSDNLGDLASLSKPKVRPEELVETCGSDTSGSRLYVQEICHHFLEESKVPATHTFGIAVADWDNDGFADIAINHDFGSLMLLRNNWGDTRAQDNKFIAFKLKGTKSNEYGIGATVLLRARHMGPHGNETTVQMREVNSASHETDWWGSKDDRIVFGLGEHGIPEKVTVRWPGKDHKEQVIEGDNILGQHAHSYEKMKVITEPK